MQAPLFKGVITALVTPFRDGDIDEGALLRLIERQIDAGVDGVAPVGTTGETSTLTYAEHERMVELTVAAVRGRVRVIAGAGSNCTSVAIDHVRHAKSVGADGALVVTPYYNRPSQEGLFLHYRAINDAVQLPVIVYNVPARTGVDISTETIERLAALPNIVGVKDATGDMSRVSRMRLNCGDDFALLSGDDGSALGYFAQGGHGVISVTSNVAPSACARQFEALSRGDLATSLQLQDVLAELHHALFLDASPAPTKFALAQLDLCTEEVRAPLARCAAAVRPAIVAAMRRAGVV